MRPEILFPLFAEVTTLDGVGTRTATAIGKVAGPRVVDLLWHLPSHLIEREAVASLAEATPGRITTVAVTVVEHSPPRNERQPLIVSCHDDAERALKLVFFSRRGRHLEQLLPPGEKRVVSGKLEVFGGDLQMVHPGHVVPPEEAGNIPPIEPVYRTADGLPARILRKTVAGALSHVPELPEWQDGAWLRQQGWPSWMQALHDVHASDERHDPERCTRARERLAYDELLASQLALALVRAAREHAGGRAVSGDGHLRAPATEALPFELTPAQRDAVDEILADMAENRPMLRLLQGDVGSGKTLVALMAMLAALEAGHQAALLAPTELLARQHHGALGTLAQAAGVEVLLLTGSDKGKERDRKLEDLASGQARLAVGTHALITDDVAFDDLALVVVDEQHRFGVHQRIALSDKGRHADVLVMTATPIPRTLQMTAFGDLDVSHLTGKPPGRGQVDTRALPLKRLDSVVEAVGRALDRGDRAYWICPVIEGSEDSDLATAEDRRKSLAAMFGERVGMIHGRMKDAEKDAAMERFADGTIGVLVATTVVEVGIDVPEATIMVVEHAERFGLAQLHQLRGRVGRGDRPSFCLLLHASPLGEPARDRIDVLRREQDGFVIAERDLQMRGAGELLGARQSGLPEFRIARVLEQTELLAAARDDARLILARDPDLTGERGGPLRLLLHLFERDSAARLLGSG